MGRVEIRNIELGITANGFRNVLVKRFLSPYKKFSSFLQKSQWWSWERIKEYQLESLKEILKVAYEHTPYYRGLMEVYDVNPYALTSFEDIERLPLLKKEDIRLHHHEMISDAKFYSMLYKCHTSGTSGKPLTLYRDLENVGFEHALLMRQWQWAGLKPNDRYVSIKGDLISEDKTDNGIFWNFSIAENKLYMSSYHLSEKNADHYIRALQKHNPLAIEGYPSSVSALAKFVRDRGIRIPMKAVLTTSETLSPEQKALIESAFDCQVYDYYGMAERVAAIHTCEEGSYHLIPEYSYVEFVDKDYLSDGYCELVGTSLNNKAMPVIRYRMSDVVKPGRRSCSCGREFPVIESIAGRQDDYIVTPSGKLIGRLDHVFKGAENLVEAQLYQPDRENLVLRLVPDKYYDAARDGKMILAKLKQRLGEAMNLEIESVASIPRGGRGKFKAVISEVNGFAY
jgi:phenylacetate-CoA ligase